MQPHRFCLPFLVASAAVAIAPAIRAAEPRPSWECLPDDTVLMVRVPEPAAFLDMLRARTTFGAVALNADRMQKAWALAVDAWRTSTDDAGKTEEIETRLATLGLEPDDLHAAFAGDMGVGFVMRPRGDGLPPLTMALAWMEPGPEAAERMVAAFHRLLEEQADDESPPQRVDLEMAGHPVTWVTRPILRADLGDVQLDGELDAERLAKLREELAERAKQAKKVRVGTLHFFLASVGGRLLAGQTLPSPPAVRVGMQPDAEGVNLNVAAEEAGDPDQASGADEARGIVERYLATHASGEASPLADVFQAPGVRAALPSGEPLAEAVLDPRPFLRMAAADDAEAARRMAAVGIADLGPVALRLAFDEGRLRQGLFVTLPAPRAGLLRILEQDCDPADVPSFVTSEAVDFTQISLDLAGVYRTIKEFATAQGGEQAANMFTTAEMQAQGWLGIELEAMLANIGSRHWIVTYAPQVAAALAEARRNRDAGPAAATSAERVAFVWKLADDAPVVALVPKIAALAQAQVVDEQGFQGVRLPGGNVCVFVGRGHLVVGMGGDALEKTLAGIRNPPAGAASLAESDVPRKAADLVGTGPARMVSMSDASRTAGMLGELRDVVAAMVPDDVEEDYRDLLARAQAIVPSAEEMQGMFGVGAALLEVNDAGVALKAAWEMPAP